jgi:hypothetical protein
MSPSPGDPLLRKGRAALLRGRAGEGFDDSRCATGVRGSGGSGFACGPSARPHERRERSWKRRKQTPQQRCPLPAPRYCFWNRFVPRTYISARRGSRPRHLRSGAPLPARAMNVRGGGAGGQGPRPARLQGRARGPRRAAGGGRRRAAPHRAALLCARRRRARLAARRPRLDSAPRRGFETRTRRCDATVRSWRPGARVWTVRRCGSRKPRPPLTSRATPLLPQWFSGRSGGGGTPPPVKVPQGKPLLLIGFNEGARTWEVNPEAAALLQKVPGPLCTLAICGGSASGAAAAGPGAGGRRGGSRGWRTAVLATECRGLPQRAASQSFSTEVAGGALLSRFPPTAASPPALHTPPPLPPPSHPQAARARASRSCSTRCSAASPARSSPRASPCPPRSTRARGGCGCGACPSPSRTPTASPATWCGGAGWGWGC